MINGFYSRRTFLKLLGAGAAAMTLPDISFALGKKYSANMGIQLYTIRKEIEKDFEKAISKIASMGFLGIETFVLPANITVEKAAKIFKHNGLEVLGMHTELPAGKHRESILRMAEAYDCKRVIYPGWPEEEKYKSRDAIKRTAEIYNEASAFLKQKGLNFGLHNHWWEFEITDGIIPFFFLLEHLEPGIFFEIDTYWAKTGGQDPAKVVQKFGKRAPLLHIKDGPAVKGDDANKQVPAGKGTLDFPAIAKAGGRNIEWMIVEFDEYSGDIFEGVKSSYNYLTEKGLAKGKV